MSVKLNFWIRPSQKNGTGNAPVYLNIHYNNTKCQYSIGIDVKLSQWDKKAQRVKGISEESQVLNDQLGAIRTKAMTIVNGLILSGEPFNAHTIREKLTNKDKRNITFDELMDEYIARMRTLKGKSYSQPTIIKYRSSQSRVAEFVKKKYKRSYVYLYELNYDFIDSFATYLKINYDNSNTTIYKHFQRISRVVRIAVNKGYINSFPFGEWSIKQDKPPLIYLTVAEVKRIEALEYNVSRLEVVRKLFLLSCYSGLSFKELENLKRKHIITDGGGVHWLTMIRQKTKKEIRVVMLPQAYEIIDYLQQYKTPKHNDKLLPMLSNQKYNSYLKTIADDAQIFKKCTSHVGRKTFTHLAFRLNLPIDMIAKLLGHSSLKVIMGHYHSVGEEEMISQVNHFGKQLENIE
jgi:integrase/recombinase XerD